MTFVVAIAIAGSLALTPLAGRLAWRLGAVSRPDGNRKLHARPTPLWGGSAVYLAAFLGVTAAYKMVAGTYNTVVLLGALGLSAGMLCLLGCYDDRYEIRAGWKLLGQIICTLPVVVAGYYVERLTLFGYGVELGWLGVLFTMGWLVVGINGINLLDGMDGLASVIGIAISVAVALIAWNHGQVEEMQLALALAGALAGFLVYNLPPARIYLGDCGSMVIGLAVSLLALRVSCVAPRTTSLTIAAALVFVPLVDTGLAVVRRSLNGHGLMVGDRGHVHHQLLDRGLGIWKVLAFLGGCCLATGAVGWWVAVLGQELWAWAVLTSLTILCVNRRLVGYEEWKLARRFLVDGVVRLARRPSPRRSSGGMDSHASMSPARGPNEPANGEVSPVRPAAARSEVGVAAADAKRAA